MTFKNILIPMFLVFIYKLPASFQEHRLTTFRTGEAIKNKLYDTIRNAPQDQLQQKTNRNYITKRNEYQDHLNFGKRPFGSASRFMPDARNGLKWVGYFCEEAFIPVLQTKNRLMVDCTVLEVRDEWEQEAAMEFFGKLMELIPLSVADAIQLITLCGSLPSQQVTTQLQLNAPFQEFEGGSTFSPVILPGTLWCGMKDIAPRYEFLGEETQLDKCCRAHDHCPIKLGAFEKKYEASNFAISTQSHCLCDLEFFRCLKKVDSQMSSMVGNFYFDFLKIDCLEQIRNPTSGRSNDHSESLSPYIGEPSLYQCISWDVEGKCRFWNKRIDIDYKFTNKPFPMKY